MSAPSFFAEVCIEADGKLVVTAGECEEGVDYSYKGVRGYHPLIVYLANTGESLRVINRSSIVRPTLMRLVPDPRCPGPPSLPRKTLSKQNTFQLIHCERFMGCTLLAARFRSDNCKRFLYPETLV